ncbi:hypothetical protein O0L34_g7843 [Tuta absoluta]|nr:hypothetical protein O0L34_g7843 [Tuta absoluta]
MQKFQKKYKSQKEYQRRLKIFKESLSRTKTLRDSDTASYGITKFSDLTPGEFRKRMLADQNVQYLGDYNRTCGKYRHREENNSDFDVKLGEIPLRFDWRKKGAVGPVVNQERCGSCYAHCVVGVMESMMMISHLATHPPRLSIQELIDCSNYTMKCDGGNPAFAMEYLCDYGLPVVDEETYPLVNRNQNCKLKNWPKKGVVLSRITKNKTALPHWIATHIADHGPVVATVNSHTWQYYTGGVISYNCDADDLNHVVQIVGYNLGVAVPYFICRNSWGADWGEEGYVRIAMKEYYRGICGIGAQITTLDVEVL